MAKPIMPLASRPEVELSSRIHARPKPPAMERMLKQLLAMAGTAKTFLALSMPMTSAARETSRMNGNMTCVRRAV